MDVGVLGTGIVGRTLAGRLADLGHDVVTGTRDVAETLARADPDASGGPPFRVWREGRPDVRLGSFADAAAHGEMVVNATAGGSSLAALRQAGEQNLEGKVLVDVANALDFSQGMPPSLLVANTDSLGEQIQRTFPGAKVVKTLNTMNASVMVDPMQVGGGDSTVFVSGDDEHAKAAVVALLRSFGWVDIVDLGDITTARGPEMLLPIWVRLYGVLQTPLYNFKIAR